MIIQPNNYNTPTYVVCGTPFSGSSLVAGTLRHLGVFMGDEFTHPGSHQDVCLSALSTHKQQLSHIRERNAKHLSWGFKSVSMRSWFPNIYPYLREPVFLFCSRGLADSLETNSKYSKGKHADVFNYIQEAEFLFEFFNANAVPWCVLKYSEKPSKLIDDIISFTGLDPTESQIKNALQFNDPRKGYTDITDKDSHGSNKAHHY